MGAFSNKGSAPINSTSPSQVLWSQMPNPWKKVLCPRVDKNDFEQLAIQVANAYRDSAVSPSFDKLFKAFESIDPQGVRVAILGHSPYQNPKLATEVPFAIPANVESTPSFKSIQDELEMEYPNRHSTLDKTLESWAGQGVLLLNTSLTIEANKDSNSHDGFGWECLTGEILKYLDENTEGVFMLWGSPAKRFSEYMPCANAHMRVLKTCHPSNCEIDQNGNHTYPFVGCGHFKQANEILRSLGQAEINWLSSPLVYSFCR